MGKRKKEKDDALGKAETILDIEEEGLIEKRNGDASAQQVRGLLWRGGIFTLLYSPFLLLLLNPTP